MYDDRQLNEAITATLESLDITPAIFDEAENHYKAVADFLSGDGAEYDISPFGSIATGTIIRPYFHTAGTYASIEEIPRELERTSLQRAIQFVKRSRDVHYCHAGGTGKKPPSCMLMVLIVKAAEELPDHASTLDIIRAFAKSMIQASADTSEGKETLIGSPGNWHLENPVYSGNLFDGDWTNRDVAELFHWIEMLVGDLKRLALGGNKSEAAARSLFGKGAAAATLNALPSTEARAAPSVIANGHKPWRPFVK